VELKESWYEKLHRWRDVRLVYERKQRDDPANLAWTLGRMRCEHALGEWEPLLRLARQVWAEPALDGADGAGVPLVVSAVGGASVSAAPASAPSSATGEARAEVARMATRAAWNLRQWGDMQTYNSCMRAHTVEKHFFGAVLAVHAEAFAPAQALINAAREALAGELSALVGESYQRAYRAMVIVQQVKSTRPVSPLYV